ncbi:amidohydrolase family protein [Desulfobacca acetoxidans]
MRLVIRGGKVFDPGSGWDGEEQDLFIQDDRIVAQLDDWDQVIAAQGLAVTPAAIDLRSPAAGYGQNYLRLWGCLPTPQELGETYALQGYTHIHEPFLTLATANYVHRELAAIPIVDTSASFLLNLREMDIWFKAADKLPEVIAAGAYLVEHTRTLNLRVVEPFIRYRQDFYIHRTLSTEAVLAVLVELADSLESRIILETTPELLLLSPAPQKFHLAALGPALVNDEVMDRASQLLEAGMSADMGLLPPVRQPDSSKLPVKIDLGWFQPFHLTACPEPDAGRRILQVALAGRRDNLAFSAASLLHTPAASLPLLVSWLTEPTVRQRDWGEVLPEQAYSFQDWLWSTRTLPAKHLGLADRGHLRPGARADVAMYDLPPDGNPAPWQENSVRCRVLLKAGEIVVNNYQLVAPQVGKATFYRGTGGKTNQLVADICQYRSFRPENLWVQPHLGVHWQQVA